jgi:NitT/TauT family transport system substrate-binding protein
MAAAKHSGRFTAPMTRRLGQLGILSALLLGLIACTPAPPEPLRIAAGPFPGYETLYLARELGLLDEQRIRLVEYAPGSQSLRAYRNGVVDGAALTADEVLQLAREGYYPRVVAVLDYSNGIDVVMARPEIVSLADLRGKRIGVENTALGAYFLSRVLYFAGLSKTDVELVPTELSEHTRAYREDRVDAVITYAPQRASLSDLGAHQLFDSSLIPGEIVDLLVVREQVVETRTDSVTHLLAGLFGALEYLRRNPESAVARMAPRVGMNETEFARSLDELRLPDLTQNRELMLGTPPPLELTLTEVMELMIREGLLDGPVEVSRLIRGELLGAIDQRPQR